MITISFVVVINNISLKRSKRDLISQKITFFFFSPNTVFSFQPNSLLQPFFGAVGIGDVAEWREREREREILSHTICPEDK